MPQVLLHDGSAAALRRTKRNASTLMGQPCPYQLLPLQWDTAHEVCSCCRSIYFSMLDGHMSQGFEPDVTKLAGKLVDATIELHRHVMNNFLPSAVKFHYQFNLRELSNITQARPCMPLLDAPLPWTDLICVFLRHQDAPEWLHLMRSISIHLTHGKGRCSHLVLASDHVLKPAAQLPPTQQSLSIMRAWSVPSPC